MRHYPRYHSNCTDVATDTTLQAPTSPMLLRRIHEKVLLAVWLSSFQLGNYKHDYLLCRLTPTAGSLKSTSIGPFRHRFLISVRLSYMIFNCQRHMKGESQSGMKIR